MSNLDCSSATVCFAVSKLSFCADDTPFTASFNLSKFATSKPTKTTIAPIPVAISAFLKPFKAIPATLTPFDAEINSLLNLTN